MALHWRPVGPEPEQTYWQRRAVLALAVLLPLLLLTALLGDDEPERLASQPAAGDPSSPVPSPLPSAAASASPLPSPTPAVVACPSGSVDVDAAATEDAYPVGSRPQLELRVSNTGSVPCMLDLGQAAVELLVTSGPDRIWSSDDCAPGGDARVITLQPGAPETTRATWPGTRSRPGCTGAKEPAQAGTYLVTGRVGTIRQPGEPFLLR